MQKLITTVLLSLFLCCMQSVSVQASTSNKMSTSQKMLVVYYSYSGNTKVVAQQIQRLTNADIFELQTVQSYPTDYDAVVKQAKQEIAEGYQPALKNQLTNLDAYEVIFVGSPCWWNTIAPAVATFLSNSQLAGKTIAPFMTHEGSGLGRSVSDIQKYAPQATVLKGLAIRGRSVHSANQAITEWIQELKF